MSTVSGAAPHSMQQGSGTTWRVPVRHERAVPFALIAALTALALLLRLPGLQQSLFGDELFAADEVMGRSFTGMLAAIRDSPEVTPPLFFILAWLSQHVVPGLDAMRVPSFVLSTAAVPVTFLLGRRLMASMVGALGALFLAISPFAIFYASEARPYAAVTFLACLSTLSLVQAAGGSRRWWVAYAAVVTAGIYTHYTIIFVLAAQTVWAAWFLRDERRYLIVATTVPVLLYVPWLPSLTDKGQLAIYGPYRFENLSRGLAQAFPGHPFALPRVLPGVPALLLLAVAVVGALAIAMATRLHRPRPGCRRRPSPGMILIVALALATPTGLLAYSAASGQNLLLPRNFSASLPSIVLLTAAVLAAPPRRFAIPLSVMAVAGVGVGTVKSLGPGFQRPDTRAAARWLQSQAGPSSPIIDLQYVAASNPASRALKIYLDAGQPVFNAANREDAWRLATRSRQSVLVAWTDATAFGSLSALAGPPPAFRTHFRLVGERRYPGIFPVFARRYAPIADTEPPAPPANGGPG